MFQRLRAAFQDMLATLSRNYENLGQTTRQHFIIFKEQINQVVIVIDDYLAAKRQKFKERTKQLILTIYQNLSTLWLKLITLIQIQNQKIQALINDYGPYEPDANIKHPPMFNFLHQMVVYLTGFSFVIIGTVFWHIYAGFAAILDNYGFWLGLIDKKNEVRFNSIRFSATLHYFSKVIAASIMFGPTMLILFAYQPLGLTIGLLHGTSINQSDWRNRRMQALTSLSYNLGFVITDTIRGFFVGLTAGFDRIRNFAHQTPSSNHPLMQTPFSNLTYILGLGISGTVGLVSLVCFDILIVSSFEIIIQSLRAGKQFIYPNNLSITNLKLQPWQKLNPIWVLTPLLFLVSASIALSVRLTLTSIIGSLHGILKGLFNEVPDVNFSKSNTYTDAFFNLIQQLLEKITNFAVSMVLYGIIINTITHFIQGLVMAFDQILPKYKLKINLLKDLNILEKNNVFSRTIGIISGLVTGFVFFFSARLVFSTLKGIGYGVLNGVRAGLYMAPLSTDKANHRIDKVFHSLAEGLEIFITNLVKIFSQMVIEGTLINPLLLTIKGLQDGYNDIFPSRRVFLIHDSFSNLKVTHFMTYLLGYPSYVLTYYSIFLTSGLIRFSISAIDGILYGLLNGVKIGLDVKVYPFEKMATTHKTDKFFYQTFKLFTALSTFFGMFVGAIAYNLPAMLNGFTYLSRQVYRDDDYIKDLLDLKHSHKSHGFIGFGMGFIFGITLAIPLSTLRFVANTYLSFYYRFMEMVSLAFQGSDWQAKLKPHDNRSKLAKYFGILGNFGLLFGLLSYTLIMVMRNVPLYFYRNFKEGFLNGLNGWLTLPQKYKIKSLLDFLPHALSRIVGNIIGFCYQNIISLGWLARQIIDLAYFDKPKIPAKFQTDLTIWQKWPGRTLAGLLYIPTLSLIAPIWIWRLIQSNCQNLIFSIQKGYQTTAGLNPQLSGFEKTLSMPSYLLGFMLGFLIHSIEQGLQQLAQLPRLLSNNFRHGLHLGLKPLVDKENLIHDKSYQYLGLPLVAAGLMLGLIIGCLNNIQLAVRYASNFTIALAYLDKGQKCEDDFAGKSGFRQIIGHLFSLPIHLILMPTIFLVVSTWRFLKMNLISISHGLTDGYLLKVSHNTEMTNWEATLSLPFYGSSFLFGLLTRGLQFISIDAINSSFNGLVEGFRLIDQNYPARYWQTNKNAQPLTAAPNPIAFYGLGMPIGALVKFITNVTSRNLENIITSAGFWYQLMWADKQQSSHLNTLYYDPLALPSIFLGHLLGFTYFILRGISRILIETLRGFLHGISHDIEARNHLNGLEKNLSAPGFYLGLSINKIVNAVIETFTKSFTTLAVVTMLPFGIADKQAFQVNNFAQGLGLGLGCILGILPLFAVSSYRLMKENIKSLKAIPNLLMNDEYPLEPGRQHHEQYWIGFIGTGIGYLAFASKYFLLSLVSSIAYCIIAVYKFIQMAKNPRFNPSVNQALADQKDTFYHLYAELNNIGRKFPEEKPRKLINCHGGKGCWAFIGKVIDFNHPSLSERMLDAVLTKFVQAKPTADLISETLNALKPAEESLEFERAYERITSSLSC